MENKNNNLSQKECDLSVVLPVFNEQASVEELYIKLNKVLNELNRSYEVVFVDDGSIDQTFPILQRIYARDKKVKLIKLKRNFGQTAALSAGIEYSNGNIIVLMDADLQHDPEDLPKFVECIDKGHDIASGWRKERADNLWIRRLPSLIANWMMAKISGIKLHDFGTTFKAYRKEVIKNVSLYGDFHRFIPVLADKFSASTIEIPIRNTNRQRGKSNYSLSRTTTVFFDLLRINFLSRYLSSPLQFFGSLGFFISFIGFAIAIWLVYMKYVFGLGLLVYRPALFMLSILLFVIGMQFLTLGLLGEIVVRAYHESGKQKTYYVEKIYD